jgi:lipoate-protein ligase A
MVEETMDRSDNRLRWWSSWRGPAGDDLEREELLLGMSAQGEFGLLTYAWPRPTLVLGYGQDPDSGIDLAYCRDKGIPVLRRRSGGAAVLHQTDLSASLSLPAGHPWAQTIRGLYDGFVSCVQEALRSFEIKTDRWLPPPGTARSRSPICFEDHLAESLLIARRKVLGCAQIRRSESVLVHGTVLFTLDTPTQARVYGVPEERIRAAMVALPPRPALTVRTLADQLAQVLARELSLRLAPETAPPLPPANEHEATRPMVILPEPEPS